MTDTLDLNELERLADDRDLWLHTDITLNLSDVYALIARAREADRLRDELRTSLVLVGNLGQRAEALEDDNKRLRTELQALVALVKEAANHGGLASDYIVYLRDAEAALDRAEAKENTNG